MLKTYTKVRGKLKSDMAVRNAKPEDKPYKRMVGNGHSGARRARPYRGGEDRRPANARMTHSLS